MNDFNLNIKNNYMSKELENESKIDKFKMIVFSETFLIGFLTLVAYFSGFLFNLGYLDYFDIPYGLLGLPLTDILSSVGVIFLFFFLIAILSDKFLNEEENRLNDFKKLFITYIPLTILCLFISLGAYSSDGVYAVLVPIFVFLVHSAIVFFWL